MGRPKPPPPTGELRSALAAQCRERAAATTDPQEAAFLLGIARRLDAGEVVTLHRPTVEPLITVPQFDSVRIEPDGSWHILPRRRWGMLIPDPRTRPRGGAE